MKTAQKAKNTRILRQKVTKAMQNALNPHSMSATKARVSVVMGILRERHGYARISRLDILNAVYTYSAKLLVGTRPRGRRVARYARIYKVPGE